MDFSTAKATFQNILKCLNDSDRTPFVSWCENYIDMEDNKAYIYLRTIAEEIKTMIPLEAILPSENVILKVNQNGVSSDPVIHVDSFLFEDEDVDKLVDEGNLKRNRCKNCGSFNIAPIEFISHSTSIRRIQYIFQNVLPDLTGKVFLDVGSRLGAMLYGAYYCSFAKRIIGVEINEDLCKLQQLIINKYALNDRIQVVCNNICNVPEVIHSANVIFFNNVFEAFMPKEMQQKIWLWLRNTITIQGTIVITVPSLEEILSKLETGIQIASWLRQIPAQNMKMDELERTDDPDLLSDVCFYVAL